MAVAAVGTAPDPGNVFQYPTLPGAAGRHGPGISNPAVLGNANSQCRSVDGEDGLPGAGAAIIHFEAGN
jgi:hypothetical protein